MVTGLPNKYHPIVPCLIQITIDFLIISGRKKLTNLPKPEFIYMLLCYHCFIRSDPAIFPKCKLRPTKKYSARVVPHRRSYTNRGLQFLKTFFRLPDNCTTNSYSFIPHKEVWSYRRITTSNKKSNKTIHYSKNICSI